ncbi:hypothetical protein BEL05_06950 [Shewanella colwelliana]|uniref:histidine kinase n=1 Tax=Shewanella colwelliana TaxID=23 RepID=A0A1E5IRE7_SHECO|nr:HAMP domain-containing sensor histidine kinase [Shewanella colwelliana]OEG73126.1 hypothetical protein BEL05_06950 [Shewanella colwelliana]
MEKKLFDENEGRTLAEAALRQITENTSRETGDQFFRVLVRDLAKALDVYYVIAGRIVIDENMKEHNQTLAIWAGDDFMDNISYPLDDTPCSNVSSQNMCFHASGICTLYPQDQLLVDMAAESYIGMSMIDTQGKTLGILVALDKKPIDQNKRLLGLSLLSIFAARCAAELQHQDREAQLESLVEQRTQTLKAAQKKLLEQEKMAALGSLVAGIAHEINTPIGVAVTGASSLIEFSNTLDKRLNSEEVTIEELQELIDLVNQGAKLIDSNLQRAASLISSFKQLAVDQSNLHQSKIELGEYINSIFIAHAAALRRAKVSYTLSAPDKIIMYLPAGKLAQLLSNLIMNSLTHAFPDEQGGQIMVNAEQEGDQAVITVADDGIGITDEIKHHIFEPFFTTRRGEGGSGLGMHIVYNIVTSLGGTITIPHSPKGLTFVITLPLSITDQPSP